MCTVDFKVIAKQHSITFTLLRRRLIVLVAVPDNKSVGSSRAQNI